VSRRILRTNNILAAGLMVLVIAAQALGASPSTAPTDSQVAAVVGTDEIRIEHVQRNMPQIPADAPKQAVERLRRAVLDRLIESALISRFLDSLPCSEEELASARERARRRLEGSVAPEDMDKALEKYGFTDTVLRRQATFSRLREDAASKQKSMELALAHPAYFNGSRVRASHILIGADRFAASTEEKLQAKKRMEEIAAQIERGEVSFEDAARKYSACPSSAKGGDLGRFSFDDMAVPFSEAAFSLEVGKTSGVVETRFGYHIIKTTERVEADTTPNQQWIDKASFLLAQKMQARIVREALATIPVQVLMK
jgi:peptidyl-prolyl cis-trans isomerase C